MKYQRILSNRAALSAAALAVFGTGLPAFAVNLLINPGFELPNNPSNEPPPPIAGWTLINDANRVAFGSTSNNTPGGRFGLWAKTFQPIGGGAFQNVGIVGGANYAFRSFLNIESGFFTIVDPVALRMQITWLDGGGSPVGSLATLDITTASTQLSGFNQYTLNATAPAGAAQARAFVGWDGGGSGTGGQSGFFDDVELDGPGIPPPNNLWITNGSGDWNAGGNWSNGSVPNGVGVDVNFLGVITSAQTVYSNTAITVGTMNFNNANTYNITGAGSLTLQATSGNAVVTVAAGSQKLNLPTFLGSNTDAIISAGATLVVADPMNLNGRTFTKTGSGTLLIEAPVRSTSPGSLVVNGGQTAVNFGIGAAATAANAAVGNVAVSVVGSKATFNADQTLRGLDAVTANAGDQEINLAGSRVRVYPANRAIEEASINADIRSAILSGTGRDGIYDSNDTSANFSVGVTDKAIDAHGDLNVLLRLTRSGDANVDGTVTLDDFTALAAQFGQTGTWDQGDFNYDGNVNLDDFTSLAANFGQSAADLPRSSVPEPTAIGLLAVAAGFVTRRRR